VNPKYKVWTPPENVDHKCRLKFSGHVADGSTLLFAEVYIYGPKKTIPKGKKKKAGSRTRSRAVTNPTSGHPCPNHCGRSFGRVQDARRHAIDTNICGGGNKRYNCKHCEKSFSRKDAVLRHQGLTGSRISCACPALQSS